MLPSLLNIFTGFRNLNVFKCPSLLILLSPYHHPASTWLFFSQTPESLFLFLVSQSFTAALAVSDTALLLTNLAEKSISFYTKVRFALQQVVINLPVLYICHVRTEILKWNMKIGAWILISGQTDRQLICHSSQFINIKQSRAVVITSPVDYQKLQEHHSTSFLL